MTGKHIAVDARMIGDGGIGTYLSELLPRVMAARPDWRFTLLGAREQLAPLAGRPNVELRSLVAPIYGVREQIEIPLVAPKADLFWSPHYNVPLAVATPLVVTIHDVAHLALPEINPLERLYARAMFAATRSRARALLFDSRFSLEEFTRYAGAPRCAATVAHLGVDEAWTRAREEHPVRPIAGPYLAYVGNFKRHKNVPGLLRALSRARDRIPHRLALIGRSEGLRSDPAIPPLLRELGDAVVTPGEVSPLALRQWVAHADALVTASRYEGFGLPPLEAMAAGVPTMVSRAGSLPEVCGDASLYCDPRDEADVAERLVQIATDGPLRERLIKGGRAHVRNFSWDRCAAETVAVLEGALG